MRIFSPQELLEGKIPSLEDFTLAFRLFEDRCVSSFIGERVISAFPYGSYARDEHQTTSDIDHFILARDDEGRDDYHRLVQLSAEEALRDHQVRIEPRVVSVRRAVNGLHGIDAAFRHFLKQDAKLDGRKGAEPFAFFLPQQDSIEDAVKSALIAYERKAVNDATSARTTELSLLENAKHVLNMPVDTARYVVLRHHARSFALRSMPLAKEGFCAEYRAIAPTTAAALDQVLSWRKEYQAMVEEARDHPEKRPTIAHHYRAFLSLLSTDGLPIVAEYAGKNLEMVTRR